MTAGVVRSVGRVARVGNRYVRDPDDHFPNGLPVISREFPLIVE